MNFLFWLKTGKLKTKVSLGSWNPKYIWEINENFAMAKNVSKSQVSGDRSLQESLHHSCNWWTIIDVIYSSKTKIDST